jgi:hypothetical protein
MTRVGIRKWGFRAVATGLITFAALQLIPYGRDHDNPPVVEEPKWDSAETRRLAVKACFSCHSNETKWPWYSNVARASWLLQRDVDAGRDDLNFSVWNRRQDKASEAAETVATVRCLHYDTRSQIRRRGLLMRRSRLS